MDRSISSKLTQAAMQMEIEKRENDNLRGLIHHSDHEMFDGISGVLTCVVEHRLQRA